MGAIDSGGGYKPVDTPSRQSLGLVRYEAEPRNELHNDRLYKVVDGARMQLATKEALQAPAGKWHTLAIRMTGDSIICSLNGKQQLTAKDDTFTKEGQVGLWTKADAQTYFDQLEVKKAK